MGASDLIFFDDFFQSEMINFYNGSSGIHFTNFMKDDRNNNHIVSLVGIKFSFLSSSCIGPSKKKSSSCISFLPLE